MVADNVIARTTPNLVQSCLLLGLSILFDLLRQLVVRGFVLFISCAVLGTRVCTMPSNPRSNTSSPIVMMDRTASAA
jgi:hypothetical protein